MDDREKQSRERVIQATERALRCGGATTQDVRDISELVGLTQKQNEQMRKMALHLIRKN